MSLGVKFICSLFMHRIYGDTITCFRKCIKTRNTFLPRFKKSLSALHYEFTIATPLTFYASVPIHLDTFVNKSKERKWEVKFCISFEESMKPGFHAAKR